MTPRTVLACLTEETGATALCEAAAALAARWEAHLIGLHVMEGLTIYPSFRVELPPSVYRDIADRQSAHAGRLEQAFRSATRDLGAMAEWRLLSAEGEGAEALVLANLRAPDLVMMGAVRGGEELAQRRRLQEAVIRGGGRPVLVVPPEAGLTGVARAVAGWRETAQATRALHDLAPLLEPGAALRLVAFERGPRLGDEGGVMTELAAAMARRGIEVEIARRADEVASVAGALEREAAEFGADVLTVGAYGRTRMHDLVLGAVSRDLLRDARVPILLSR